MDGALRFPMLQIREHIDTLLDRKDQTSEVLWNILYIDKKIKSNLSGTEYEF